MRDEMRRYKTAQGGRVRGRGVAVTVRFCGDGLDLFSQFNISCTLRLCAIYPPIDFVFVLNIMLDRDFC